MNQQRPLAIKGALVSFLYDLLRDHLPFGTVAKLVEDAKKVRDHGQGLYTNRELAIYAVKLSEELMAHPIQNP